MIYYIKCQLSSHIIPNKFLVRLFISYHLHIYRLVSVIHSINAAFGVSQKFVPHRVPYDVLDHQVPIVKFAQPTTGTDYQCISDIAFNIPKKSASTIAADRIYRITACACFSNSRPTGVIISRSNDPSTYTNSGQLVAKEERSADSTEGSLTKSVIWFNGSEVNDQNLYVWVKYNSSAQNRIYAVLEYLQN